MARSIFTLQLEFPELFELGALECHGFNGALNELEAFQGIGSGVFRSLGLADQTWDPLRAIVWACCSPQADGREFLE